MFRQRKFHMPNIDIFVFSSRNNVFFCWLAPASAVTKPAPLPSPRTARQWMTQWSAVGKRLGEFKMEVCKNTKQVENLLFGEIGIIIY